MIKSRLIQCTSRLIIGLLILLAPSHPVQAQTTPEPPEVTIHIVQDGETTESIAATYRTTAQAIQQANAITNPRDIFVGQRLIIPGAKETTPGPILQATIIAGLGDTLTTLALQYGTTPELLGATNRIANPSQLYAGQMIAVPAAKSAGLVRVEETNSFWRIALKANTNAVALMTLNHITNPFVVAPGSIIVLPNTPDVATAPPLPWASLTLHPLPLEQGRTGGLRLTTSIPGTVTATFLSQDLQITSQGVDHMATFGIDRWTAPGLYPLAISLQDETGTTWTYSKDVLIANGEYAREEIRVTEETSAVLDDAQSVQEEIDYIKKNMSGFTPQRHWDGLFMLPTAGILTSPFGSVRTYQGRDAITFHTGTDLAIKTGTPIYAPADGVVVDTGFLTVRGYVTLIDHGIGVYTGYWHQSDILVKPGDEVAAGQQIGAVGSTGLSTASHLHWEMWVGGVQVDPMQWVRELFP